MKIRQLLNIKECEFKAYIDSFNLYTRDKKNIMISNTYKNIIKNYILRNYSDSGLIELINKELEDSYFITKHEKQAVANNIFTNLDRYRRKVDNYIVDKDIKDNIGIENKEIQVKVDVVYEIDDNTYEIVKIKTSKPTLSLKARNADNLPENDIELYCMYLLGKKLYPNKRIIASYHHMGGKKDSDKEGKVYYNILLNEGIEALTKELSNYEDEKNNVLDKKELKKIDKSIKLINEVLNYNFTEGNNIVSSYDQNNLDDKILELYNTQLSSESEKCCDDNKCSMCDYSVYCKNKKPIQLEELKQLDKIQKEVHLTEEQEDVYLFNKGICKVLAGAGSGKSTTMAMRILRVIKEGCNPKDILLITFTEKGAKELKDKIISLSQFYKTYFDYNDLKVYTFNSYGQTLIEKEYELLGYDKCPELATNIDILDILKELVEENENISWLNYKNPLMSMRNYKGALIQLKTIFDKMKAFNYTEDELKEYLRKSNLYNIEDKDLNKAIEDIVLLYNKFNSELFKRNLIQYQDQILLATKILRKNLNKYGYKHIVVDEYQDTDKSQVDILKELVKYNEFESLMVVGDTNQSIFGFRNTTPENIINFEKDFDNVEVKYMMNNFRSTPQIVDLANKFISQNESCNKVNAVAKKDNGKEVVLKDFSTLKDERNYIIDLIKEKLREGTKLTDICYIGRTKKELLELQELLQENNISSNVRVMERYIDNSQVQSILNLAYYFKDITKNYYLWEFMNINGVYEADKMKEYDILINNNLDNNESIIEIFFNIAKELITDRVAIDFINKIEDRNYHTLNELLTYLNKISLYNDDTSVEKDDKLYNAITLTTGHGSKGLEWKIVVSGLDKFEYDDIEEDRRLLYVVLTRAMDELYLTYNKNMDKSRNKGKHPKCVDEIIKCMEE